MLPQSNVLKLLGDDVPQEVKDFIQLRFVQRCELVVVADRLGRSLGETREIEECLLRGLRFVEKHPGGC